MKKIFRTVAALAVVMFAGCTNDLTNEVVAPTVGTTTVTVGIADTKIYIGDLEEDGTRKMLWHDGDQLAINGNASTAIERSEDKTSATFEFGVALQTPYEALYPASAYVDAQTIHLNSFQGRGLDGIQEDVLPMAGYSANEGDVITLHHLAGAVKLQIKMAEGEDVDHHSIRRVEISGNNNEQMAGDFLIDYENLTLTPAGTNAASKVVAEVNKDNPKDGSVLTVFVIVPAREYTNGFTLRLIDKAGHYMDIASKAITVEKGEIKAMPAVEFKPTGTVIDTEIAIASAADWNTFVKDYNESKYTDVLVNVKLTQDIVFDDATNAEFATLAGTDNDYEFEGTIDGQNFAFKGLKSNKAIIHATSGAVIKNLVIDSSCEFTYTGLQLENELECIGILAKDIFTSTIENCTNKANMTLDNCTASSDIEVCIGAIAGRTNGDCVVKNCTNEGKLEVKANCVIGTTKTDGVVNAGGFVGYSRCGLIGCVNKGEIACDFTSNTKNTGGIAGRVTATGYIDGCTNEGAINDASLRNPKVDMVYDHNRTVRLAGITAVAACDVKNCTNSGDITTSTGAKDADIAGILAYVNASNIDLSGNSNTGDININAPVDDVNTSGDVTTGIRYLYAGGLIGNSNNVTLADLDCTGKTFSGTINIATVENASQTTVAVGGVVGGHTKTNASLWTIQNVDYTGRITLSNLVNCTYCHLGGVVGRVCSPTHINKATNSGAVECKDTGAIAYKDVCFGGILGSNLDGVATTITESTNSGTIQFQNNTNKYGRATAVGGIAGALTGAASTIQLCTNTGYICSHNRSNANEPAIRTAGSNFGGGIVGFIQGTSDAKATIDQCTVNKTDSSANSTITMGAVYAGYGIYASRGVLGGMVGYASHTNISNCDCSATIEKTQQGYMAALVAWLDNSTIEECTVTASKVKADNANIIGRGSLVGKVVASVVKNNEVSFALEGTAASGGGDGVLAGVSDNASTFTNNAVSGTFFGAAITLDSKMIGTGTPTVTGTTLYTE